MDLQEWLKILDSLNSYVNNDNLETYRNLYLTIKTIKKKMKEENINSDFLNINYDDECIYLVIKMFLLNNIKYLYEYSDMDMFMKDFIKDNKQHLDLFITNYDKSNDYYNLKNILSFFIKYLIDTMWYIYKDNDHIIKNNEFKTIDTNLKYMTLVFGLLFDNDFNYIYDDLLELEHIDILDTVIEVNSSFDPNKQEYSNFIKNINDLKDTLLISKIKHDVKNSIQELINSNNEV